MSKVYHSRTAAVTARPRSQRLREAGYYKVNSSTYSNDDQTSFETGPALFEGIVDTNGEFTGAKALYDIFIKQVEADEEQQIEEQLKNATEILKHLFLVPNDGRPYLRSDIGFVSEDFVSGAGLSTTQGGGGGGGSIATLSDVSLSGLANGNILRYDASVGMWRNEALNLGTAASYNIGIVAQGDNGLVTGGAVYDAINTILSSAVKFVGITTTALTDGSTTSTVTIDGASHTAQRGDVVIYGGKEFLWTGSKWQQMGDEASWALKTVTITGAGYLTGGGTLEANRTIDIADGIKTMIQHGDTAFGWGNHATAGYALADNLTTLAGRVTTLEGRTDWDEYLEIDDNGDIHVKGNRGLWSDSFLSGAGLSSSSSGGGSGVDLDAMWGSLTNSVTDAYANTPIALAHIPDINTSKITNLESWILGKGYASASDLSGYLPLTGGTLTGPLTVDSALSVTGLASFSGHISLTRSGANKIQATAANGALAFYTGGDTTDYAMLISENKYVTVTNSLLANRFIYGRNEDFRLYIRDYVSSSTPTDKIVFRFYNDADNGKNTLYIGSGTYSNTPTYIYGKEIRLATHNGSSGATVMTVASSGYVGIGVTAPEYHLDVNGDIRARNRLYIGTGGAYIEVDSNGDLHTSSGLWSDSFLSGAGLSSSSSGGGSGVDLDAMWGSLTNSVTDAYANTPIALAHIPDINTSKITNLESWILGKGYASASDLSGYLPLSGGTLNGALTVVGNNTAFRIKRNSGTTGAYVSFANNGGDLGYVGLNNNAELELRMSDWATRYFIWHSGNDGDRSGLDADLLDGQHGSYYATAESLAGYVSAVAISGNYLRITKGGANTDLMIPYAVSSDKITMKILYSESNIPAEDALRVFSGAGSSWTGSKGTPWSDMAYGAILALGRPIRGWQMWAQYGIVPRSLYWRHGTNATTWESEPHMLYDDKNLTQSVITDIIGSATYAPYNADGYLPLTGGELTGPLEINSTLTTNSGAYFGNNINLTGAGANYIRATDATGHLRFVTGGASTADYAMSIGTSKSIAMYGSLSVASSVITGGNFYARSEDFRLMVRDTISSESGVDRIAFWFRNLNGANNLYIGYGTNSTAPTLIYGKYLGFYTNNGSAAVRTLHITDVGNVGIGLGSSSPAYKLDVAGDIRARNRLYIGTGGAYIEMLDGAFHFSSGIYSDSFISGSGLSTTQGSGGGGASLDIIWNSLTNSVTDAYANVQIDIAHVPDITTAKVSNIEDWISQKGFITAASLPLAASGVRGGIQIGYTTDATNRNYAVQLSSEQAYVNVPWIEYNFTGVSFTSGDQYTGTHDANAIMSNGVWYYKSHGPAISIGASTNDGALYSQAYSIQWVAQIAQDYRNGRLFFRARNNSAWTTWLTNIDSGNYASILDPWVESKGYALAASIPAALPNPYVLSFGGKTYDGSAATTLTAADLGALTSINVTNYDSTLSRNASSMTLARVQGTAITVSVPNFALVSDIPIELPNPKALTFNTSQRSYDGSAAMTITAADLGALTTVQVVNYDSTLSRNASSMTLARVHGTAITVSVPNFALVSDIPTALPNPYALSFGSKTYDGSASRTITASDFGLGSAASNIDTLFSYFNGYGAANEAVQLTTTRTIWGQEFDGTQNVSGAISGATTGAFSSWVQASYYYVGSSATAYLDYRNNMLHANVGFYADGPLSGAGLSTTSDVRLKTDIIGISFEKARSVIAELRPVTFRWRADGTLAAGFIAQEVAPFLPDAVTEVGGTLRLKYDQIFTYGMAVLSGLLGKTESIERRVQRLEGEVQLLREENNRLRARLNA